MSNAGVPQSQISYFRSVVYHGIPEVVFILCLQCLVVVARARNDLKQVEQQHMNDCLISSQCSEESRQGK